MIDKLGLHPLKPKAVSFGLIVLIVTGFLWIARDYVYGPYASIVETRLLAYLVFFFIVAVPFAQKLPTLRHDPRAPLNFVIGFIATFLVVTGVLNSGLLPRAMLASTVDSITIYAAFAFLHSFVGAYIEELVFRYFLPVVANLGDIISSLLFGLFHIGVRIMSGDPLPWLSIAVLTALGLVWAIIRGRHMGNGRFSGLGLMGATGSHFAWNVIAFGLI